MYGHVAKLASSLKAGALHAPPRSNLPIATLDVLKSADGILLGISTRFGTLPAQVKELFDACGDL
ncbi:hypothetical protein PF002_g19392 [Phytophthora fragariae]|uniref:Flavodoxin-like domain-containing protein n=1 Tax=Phytophthora fragariae TaxID=53985 RepID=A0A6A3XUA6_9STRA|nr:hypothetical protein PF002_g19392 [Phytophthora fragariae]